ncbi:hypothetical protein CPC08DRAFT_711732 [Agrocybe pediades]|nr:hypothetical protein CPC08DRAFT_711732 [Agrocybe pediades]
MNSLREDGLGWDQERGRGGCSIADVVLDFDSVGWEREKGCFTSCQFASSSSPQHRWPSLQRLPLYTRLDCSDDSVLAGHLFEEKDKVGVWEIETEFEPPSGLPLSIL